MYHGAILADFVDVGKEGLEVFPADDFKGRMVDEHRVALHWWKSSFLPD